MYFDDIKMPRANTKPAHPYPDYVDGFEEAKHQYLHQLLKLDQAEKYQDGDEIRDVKHEFLFADIIEDTFRILLFQPATCSKIRVLLFSHSFFRDNNRFYINAIAWKFKLDPRFLEDHCAMGETGAGQVAGIQIPLPSEVSWFQVVVGLSGHFTACVRELDGLRTIVIFAYYANNSSPLSGIYQNNLFETAFASFAPEEVQAIETFPPNILCRLIEGELHRANNKFFTRHGLQRLYSIASRDAPQCGIFFQSVRLSLVLSLNNTKGFLKKYCVDTSFNTDTWRRWHHIIDNFEVLVEDYKRIESDIVKHLQASQNVEAICQARHGYEQFKTLRK
ncbi:uncharacterized protein PAC_17844 [Phialocephala subalpina]|uniref:Uncharacterized protein n=1 Tax=Phialocephala subalpina TaxID=576137 RepID=A0A1L7XSG7_9HELO|nr:uncharacterized protein PAC_17844 [Phialocephala subalpina]